MVFFSVRLESHETDEISLQVVVFCKQSIPPPFNVHDDDGDDDKGIDT